MVIHQRRPTKNCLFGPPPCPTSSVLKYPPPSSRKSRPKTVFLDHPLVQHRPFWNTPPLSSRKSETQYILCGSDIYAQYDPAVPKRGSSKHKIFCGPKYFTFVDRISCVCSTTVPPPVRPHWFNPRIWPDVFDRWALIFYKLHQWMTPNILQITSVVSIIRTNWIGRSTNKDQLNKKSL